VSSNLAYNGMPAPDLNVEWHNASNPNGSCVDAAKLPDGGAAFRNSRDPGGPALVYTRAEITVFIAGVKAGKFDFLAN
jgi:hypothetical protein